MKGLSSQPSSPVGKTSFTDDNNASLITYVPFTEKQSEVKETEILSCKPLKTSEVKETDILSSKPSKTSSGSLSSRIAAERRKFFAASNHRFSAGGSRKLLEHKSHLIIKAKNSSSHHDKHHHHHQKHKSHIPAYPKSILRTVLSDRRTSSPNSPEKKLFWSFGTAEMPPNSDEGKETDPLRPVQDEVIPNLDMLTESDLMNPGTPTNAPSTPTSGNPLKRACRLLEERADETTPMLDSDEEKNRNYIEIVKMDKRTAEKPTPLSKKIIR